MMTTFVTLICHRYLILRHSIPDPLEGLAPVYCHDR